MHIAAAAVGAVDRCLRGHTLLAAILLAQTALLAALAPALFADDSWLTLVAGRHVWAHGIPAEDPLAVYTAGRAWIDQQWLAQLAFHGAHALGDLPLVFVFHVSLLIGATAFAMGVARQRGGSTLSVSVIAVLAFLVAPWTWQPRAQSLAYPLFVALVALLLGDDGRARPRTLLVLPLLALWANVHGSVLAGAALAFSFAVLAVVASRRGGTDLSARHLALLLSPLCVLATPYGLETLRYYAAVLGNPLLGALAPEWQRPAGAESLHFLLLAIAAVMILAVGRRQVTPPEVVLVAGTLLVSLTAVRHFVWFAFAALVVLPRLVPLRAMLRPTRVGRAASWACLGALAAIGAALLAQPPGWFLREWPESAGHALVEAVESDPGSTVFVHGREADWLLWSYPSLEGRIAYDARLELLSSDELRGIVRFDRRRGSRWSEAVDGFTYVWVNSRLRPEHAPSLLRTGTMTTLYQDGEVTVLRRRL